MEHLLSPPRSWTGRRVHGPRGQVQNERNDPQRCRSQNTLISIKDGPLSIKDGPALHLFPFDLVKHEFRSSDDPQHHPTSVSSVSHRGDTVHVSSTDPPKTGGSIRLRVCGRIATNTRPPLGVTANPKEHPTACSGGNRSQRTLGES